MFIGVQFVLGDVFGITMTNFQGVEMRSQVLDIMRVDTLNQNTQGFMQHDQPLNAFEVTLSWIALGWELITLLTGTYVFNILVFFGVPSIFVAGLIGVYFIMMGRTILGYIRGM